MNRITQTEKEKRANEIELVIHAGAACASKSAAVRVGIEAGVMRIEAVAPDCPVGAVNHA